MFIRLRTVIHAKVASNLFSCDRKRFKPINILRSPSTVSRVKGSGRKSIHEDKGQITNNNYQKVKTVLTEKWSSEKY